jgi:hypothetical protein
VHIRRALLLFAIVLGMAALVASFSRPPEQRTSTEPREETAPATVTAEPAPADNPRRPILFDADSDETRRVPAGRAATLEVTVDEPGAVEIPGLGLSVSTNEHTPARFQVFPTRSGDYELLFTPARGDQSEPAGKLVVTSAG